MTDRQTIAVYDTSLDAYLAVPILENHRAALDRFIARLPEGGRVLDIGSGPGLYAEHMMAAGLQVDATDASATFVAEARTRGIDARQATFDDLPGDARYNGIWASFSLLHAPLAAVPGHIRRLAAALDPPGLFFLGMKTGTGESRDRLGRFFSYFSVAELQAGLTDAGLDILETETGNAKGLAGVPDTHVLITAQRHG